MALIGLGLHLNLYRNSFLFPRSWNTYYSALCGSLLIFFKDKKSRDEMKLTSSMPPPLNVENSNVRSSNDYKGRKHVFELKAPDGAEFLFDVSTEKERDEWINSIQRAAGISLFGEARDKWIMVSIVERATSRSSQRTREPKGSMLFHSIEFPFRSSGN